MKIHGFDKLRKTLAEAQNTFADLDGDVGKFTFNPSDPLSVANAIAAMESAVDKRAGPNAASNPLVRQVVAGLKKKFRAHILSKVPGGETSPQLN